ncbi:hypothetical protein Goshw_008846 [Gossypium schwendimanii]|uniref:Uncharacterized protein n=1 Tax=Gossypium schwendimanii TaxID=34291 RepID=A0A7J9KR05_GOSSC|nr:hypothetical protein [Gossypium schwendimanii]
MEDGDLKSADAFLQNILILADQISYLYEGGMVKYFGEDLVRRAYGLHPPSSYFTFPFFIHYRPSPAILYYILAPFLKKLVKLEDELKVVFANSLVQVDECEIDFKRSRDDEIVVV